LNSKSSIKTADQYHFEEGEVLLFDKPLGWSSFQLVRKVKNILQVHLNRVVKVGHAGTLDPLATGLMVICTGKATKQAMELTAADKAYTATLQLGFETDSFDLETPVRPSGSFAHLTTEQIQETLHSMEGEQWQTPPVFSAKKIDGKRAYKYARQGETVEMRKQLITLHEVVLLSYVQETGILSCHIRCTKGTYIRSFAHELGQKLGSGAYLTELRRTASDPFHLEDALCIDAFKAALPPAKPRHPSGSAKS
jgi:tRNA pseudouridine55 synthase